jgi:type II secretory pathway pseudopilin PulG
MKRRREAGYTMIEVVVSILLTATLVSAVFSVALSTTQSTGKTDRKMLAAQAQRALTSALKGYVTADRNSGLIFGPNAAARGNNSNSWNIHTPGVQTDSAGDVYALSPYPNAGTTTHTLTCIAAPGADAGCFLPKIMRDAPVSGTVTYVVNVSAVNAPPRITVTVNYNDL